VVEVGVGLESVWSRVGVGVGFGAFLGVELRLSSVGVFSCF
jgi:hypothetical protein